MRTSVLDQERHRPLPRGWVAFGLPRIRQHVVFSFPEGGFAGQSSAAEYNLAMVVDWRKKFYKRQEFIRADAAIGAGDVIRWWENRRLFFNLTIGISGLVTCVLLVVCALTAGSLVGESIGMPDGPLLGVFMIVPYALLANACCTAGWISELMVRTTRTANDAAAFAVRAFRAGITFSICVTLSPAVISWLVFAVAWMKGQKHGPPGE